MEQDELETGEADLAAKLVLEAKAAAKIALKERELITAKQKLESEKLVEASKKEEEDKQEVLK